MNEKVDLHLHTMVSDGRYKPGEVVRMAKKLGLSSIAITDHDSVFGVEEAILEGIKLGVEVIPGIEVSVDCKNEMHILGYFIDYKNEDLIKFAKENEAIRKVEIRRCIIKLNRLGIVLNLREIEEKYGKITVNSLIGEMINLRYVQNQQEAYDLYFGRGKIGYVKGYKLDPRKSIELIKNSGGIAVLAHLSRISRDEEEIERIVKNLKEFGLDGLEGYYPAYTPELQEYYIRLANKYGLVVTGGSDFHDEFRGKMGYCSQSQCIPCFVVKNIKEKI